MGSDIRLIYGAHDVGLPLGWASKPVQWVSSTDAGAFCTYYNKRLPHTWEWQYAAQGEDGRKFPWGDVNDGSHTPQPSTARSYPVPDDVGAHPTGASPFGVMDMLGNVFQWTDMFDDEHTTMAVVRGGSNYVPHEASKYYFQRPKDLFEHNTLLSMSDSMDRSAGIGFRCVVDAEPVGSESCPWQLCGTSTPLPGGTLVELSRATDWAHFGHTSFVQISRASRGTRGKRISVSMLNADSVPQVFLPLEFPGFDVVNYGWNDAAPPAQEQVLATGRGIRLANSPSPGDGFRISVQPAPAGELDQGQFTVVVYAGVYKGKAKLTAQASAGDNSFVSTLESTDSVVKRAFTINVRVTDSWPLAVTWELEEAFASDAHVSVFAVTITGG